jgi:pilus assembly protein Flp/PilA
LYSVLHRAEGQGLAEYALILALIALVAIIAVTTMGTNLSTLLDSIGTQIGGL